MARPRPKINPRVLMEKALQLIENELAHLKAASKLGKLEGTNPTELIRYADALLKYVKDGIGQEEEEKKAVSKMTDEELLKAAADLAAKAKKY